MRRRETGATDVRNRIRRTQKTGEDRKPARPRKVIARVTHPGGSRKNMRPHHRPALNKERRLIPDRSNPGTWQDNPTHTGQIGKRGDR